MTDLRKSSARLSAGLAVSGQAEHVARAVAIDRDMVQQERLWVSRLRAADVKAAHPDDGWVDRLANKVHLAYPQFNDGLGVGDVLALGWPWRDVRMVRIVETREILHSPQAPALSLDILAAQIAEAVLHAAGETT